MTVNYDVDSKTRKELAEGIESILDIPKKYRGGIMAAREIYGYTLDRKGSLTGWPRAFRVTTLGDSGKGDNL